tara:strand:+ start:1925 stop:2557 length:633 start_codon:yes stop_codon:yes gene_type:complete
MGRQVSVTKLKEQIETARRGLAKMSPMITAADPAFQPVAVSTANFANLVGGYKNDVPDTLNQIMVANDGAATDNMAATDMANDDVATIEGFQFFHRPKRFDRPFAPLSSMSMANADISTRDHDQPLFQVLDQRLDRLEGDVAQNQKHVLELITLLSGLDVVKKPTRQNSASVKYLLRRRLFLFVIAFLVIGWVALTPSGHIWINHFLSLI